MAKVPRISSAMPFVSSEMFTFVSLTCASSAPFWPFGQENVDGGGAGGLSVSEAVTFPFVPELNAPLAVTEPGFLERHGQVRPLSWARAETKRGLTASAAGPAIANPAHHGQRGDEEYASSHARSSPWIARSSRSVPGMRVGFRNLPCGRK